MIIKPPGSDLSDPFFDAVRRRHPDVDIVLLPPVEPAEGSSVEISDAESEAALAALEINHEQVRSAAAVLWSVATESTEPVPVTFRPGLEASTIRVSAAASAQRETDAETLLSAVTAALIDSGWTVDRPDSGLPRVIGHRDGLRAMVTYAPTTGVVRLTVDGDEHQVGRAAAAALLQAGDGQRRR